MASARTVIANIDSESEVYSIINDSGCGIALHPGDIKGLIDSINMIYRDRSLIAQYGDKGRKYLISHFSRSKMTALYTELINNMLKTDRTLNIQPDNLIIENKR